MPRMTVARLNELRDKVRTARAQKKASCRANIVMHMGTCGVAAGAAKILARLETLIKEKKADDVLLTTSGCAGLCSREPIVTIERPDQAPAKYAELTEEKLDKIFEEHVLGGRIVKEYVLGTGCETTH